MGGMADTKWLIQQRRGWYAVVEVPADLRAQLGRRIKVTLQTTDLRVAQAKRHQALATIQARIAAARAIAPGQRDPVMQEAVAYRETFEAMRRGRRIITIYPPVSDNAEPLTQEEFVAEHVSDRARELHEEGHPDLAGAFYGIATGTATPIRHHVETWLSEGGTRGPVREKTKGEYRVAVSRFADWLERERLAPTLESVTRKVAGRYLSDVLFPSGVDAATNRKRITALSSYWTWLRRRGHLDDDGSRTPWEGQSPSKVRATGQAEDTEERPFTDDEVRRLLTGSAGPTLAEFMRVAALTGMRREEIGQLRVDDIQGANLRVRGTKSAAARRTIPIHPDLAGILEARTVGKPSGSFVFHELKAKGDARADPLGKLFTRYRRGLGIQDGEGRRSRVNFHSFRRWFITKARAKADLAIVQAIVGHRPDNLTDGVYSGGPTERAKRACVQGVKLPT